MKSYFQFTRRQKIGVAALATIILVLVIILNVNNHRSISDPSDVDVSNINFSSSQPETIDSSKVDFIYIGNGDSDPNKTKNKNYDLFYFNPNTLDKSGWERLGFSEKQAESIVKYRSNYGPFEKAEDVKKIYVVSEEKYEEIKPYMTFEPIVEDEILDDLPTLINVNIATQEELESINGIGPTFAKRTIKYRQILGGFASRDQFKSIYGITEDALKALEKNTFVDRRDIKMIKINSASKDEIKSHPYLKDWAVVAEILSQRDKSKLNNLNFLLEKDLMNKDQLNQVLPYISFE